jgi:hypothetical protein
MACYAFMFPMLRVILFQPLPRQQGKQPYDESSVKKPVSFSLEANYRAWIALWAIKPCSQMSPPVREYIVVVCELLEEGGDLVFPDKEPLRADHQPQSMRTLRPPWTTLLWSPMRDMTHFASFSFECIEARAKESVLWAKWRKYPYGVFLTAITPIAPTE